ncbi:MAG: NAD(P)/FAD-dependent oxidoreductase [Candidatus Thorarchaeota archaeon]|nr:MAG: NAD(P)/FAD-dependent oxidoreductase [Candidatus Thorarchaeota archaeon]
MQQTSIDEIDVSKYDAVVLGAGAGGLLTSLALSANGKRILILEKESRLGGVWHGYRVGDFRVDQGLHVITRVKHGAFTRFLRTYLDPPPEFVLHEGWFFRVHDKVGTIPSTIGETLRWPLTDLRGRLGLARIGARIKTMKLEEMRKYKDITFLEFMMSRGADNQVILDVMQSAIFMAAGVPIDEASAYEALRTLKDTDKESSKLGSAKRLIFGSSEYDEGYVIGGMQNLVERVVDAISGDYVLNVPVERIVARDGKVSHFVAGGREFQHPFIVSNIPLWFMPGIVDSDRTEDQEFFKKWSNMKYTKGLTIWLGLSEVVIGDRKSRVIVHPNPNTWIISLSSFDPSCAPKGKELVGVATVIREDETREAKVEEVREKVLRIVHPEILDHIEMQHVQVSYATRAALIPGQTALDRPGPETPIEGLYIVGTDTAGEGVGLQQAANSAEGVAKTLFKRIGD